ncbi:MFS transporter [Actinoplanes sp. CA-054009]
MRGRFWWLWGSVAASVLGDALRIITVALWAYEISGGSALAVSGTVIAQYLPGIVAGPYLGRLVDRYDRRVVMVVSDVFRAFTSGLLVAGVVTGSLTTAFVAICLASVAAAAFTAASESSLPSLVPETAIGRANSILGITAQVGYVLGPAVGAVVYAFAGAAPALIADVASFLVSALLLSRLPVIRPAPGDRQQPGAAPRGRLKSVFADRVVTWSSVTFVMVFLQAGINNTALLPFVEQSLDQPAELVSTFSVANGVAQILTGTLLVVFIVRLDMPRLLAWSAFLMMIGGWGFALAGSLPVSLAAMFVVALANAPVIIAIRTLRQTRTPDAVLGRTSAVINSAANAALLVGSAAAGVVAEAFGPRWAIVAGALALTVGAAAAAGSRPGRRAEAAERDDSARAGDQFAVEEGHPAVGGG